MHKILHFATVINQWTWRYRHVLEQKSFVNRRTTSLSAATMTLTIFLSSSLQTAACIFLHVTDNTSRSSEVPFTLLQEVVTFFLFITNIVDLEGMMYLFKISWDSCRQGYLWESCKVCLNRTCPCNLSDVNNAKRMPDQLCNSLQ